jgi:hypothetical protein
MITMAILMKASEFVKKLENIAKNHKTVYVYGAFGAPVTTSLLTAKAKQYPGFYTASKKAQLAKYAGQGYWGFDCVNLIKGVLWGWSADKTKTNGGAKYKANGVPDTNADGMIKLCSGVTTDFSKIEIGEAVWCSGHIGVYIGNGLAIECTPAWKNNVQITAVKNIGAKTGYNARKWTKHGKLPWIDYSAKAPATKPTTTKKPATSIKEVTASEGADKFDKNLSATYVTTGNVHLRNDAGVTNKSLCVIPKGTKVRCYGYYSLSTGVKWLYVQVTLNGVKYTGFSSSKYLKKA